MGGLLLGIFGVLVLAAVPIGFALAIAAVLAIVVADLPLIIIPQQIVAGMDSFPMLAVPLFILAGFIMDVGGISRRLVTLARTLVGHLPGGLGQVVIMAEIFFSGVSGSTSADAAAIGGIMVPQLTANGYSRARATAIVSAACGMGILIPPAIVMVVYGVIGNVSIGALFVASIAPALLIAVGLMTQIGWQARRQGWPAQERASMAEIRRAAVDAALPLFMIVVILGGIRFGFFTPTEAAAVAVAYALLLAGPVYRSLTARDLWNKVVQTAMVSGMVLFVVGAARLLGWVLAVMQVPQTLASSVVGMGGGQAGFMVLTILVFLVLGAILEGVPAVVLLAPILLPLARELGIDPVHYGTVRHRHRGDPGDLRVPAARGGKPPGGVFRGRGRAGGGRASAVAVSGADVGAYGGDRVGAGSGVVAAGGAGVLSLAARRPSLSGTRRMSRLPHFSRFRSSFVLLSATFSLKWRTTRAVLVVWAGSACFSGSLCGCARRGGRRVIAAAGRLASTRRVLRRAYHAALGRSVPHTPLPYPTLRQTPAQHRVGAGQPDSAPSRLGTRHCAPLDDVGAWPPNPPL